MINKRMKTKHQKHVPFLPLIIWVLFLLRCYLWKSDLRDTHTHLNMQTHTLPYTHAHAHAQNALFYIYYIQYFDTSSPYTIARSLTNCKSWQYSPRILPHATSFSPPSLPPSPPSSSI